MGFFIDIAEYVFGSPKENPDYSAELEKVKKDYDELRGLMAEWRQLPLMDALQKRLEALNKDYHPIVLLIVGHPVKDFYDTVEFYIKKLELAVQGNADAINYIEDTKKGVYRVLDTYKRRLQNKMREVIESEESKKIMEPQVVDWPAIKQKILSDVEKQENILRVYAPKAGEEQFKLGLFVKERLNGLNSRSMSLPARLVWALVPGQVYIERYKKLVDDIIAADEKNRKKSVSDLKELEKEIEIFLTKEYFRVKNKYSYLPASA